ncbi:MAG: hypothetical protein MUF00_02190 [Gemmatimonadaceae bacterium]|jgi:hypothetical protein|nr:hypothetical protein [Gemmatimonadaceae bacterium]
MGTSQRPTRTLPLDVRATLTERPANLGPLAVYAFSKGGALLDTKPLTDASVQLAIPVGDEPDEVRVVVGPALEKDEIDVGELMRRGAVERHLAVRPKIERLAPIDVALRPDIVSRWIGRLCVVKGTLTKRVISGGITLRLPVCRAHVDIWEVDPWHLILPQLPDIDIDRLRDIVDGPWPPIDLPIPPRPPVDIDIDLAPDVVRPPRALSGVSLAAASRSRVDAVALNPQPLPPRARRLRPGVIQGFDPQPDPPRPQFSAAVQLAARGPRAAFERAVLADLATFRPIFCWLYPRFVRKTKLTTVVTDECGHFTAIIWRSWFNPDEPDLYFSARQRVFFGFFVSIYEPTPVGCHTWWNYRCGTEVSLVTTHPLARTCAPCPPIVAPNNWVLFMAIGNTSVWRIHGANDTTHVGAPGFESAKRGLVDDTAPWGGTLRPRLEFDSSLRTIGVRYYRVSFKRVSEPETAWRHSTEAVNRHYTQEIGDDLVLQQYPLGPATVGATPHLYEIPPALPPVGQWSLPNVVLDTQSAVFPTTDLAPGVGFDAGGSPTGTDQGGLWQIRVELFTAAGVQVDPEALGIKWRVPESADLTGTIQTADAATLGLVDAARNCMIVTVRVDNNPCLAGIEAPLVGFSAAADQCGVMNYSARSEIVTTPFVALQRNRFADFSFYVQRGAVSPPELSASGQAAATGPTMPPAPSETVGNLLDTCTLAGFTEQLYVAHRATDGWGRQSGLDRSAARAFVLAPATA